MYIPAPANPSPKFWMFSTFAALILIAVLLFVVSSFSFQQQQQQQQQLVNIDKTSSSNANNLKNIDNEIVIHDSLKSSQTSHLLEESSASNENNNHNEVPKSEDENLFSSIPSIRYRRPLQQGRLADPSLDPGRRMPCAMSGIRGQFEYKYNRGDKAAIYKRFIPRTDVLR